MRLSHGKTSRRWRRTQTNVGSADGCCVSLCTRWVKRDALGCYVACVCFAEAETCATSWSLQGIAVPAGYTGSTKQMASRRQWAPDLQWEVPMPEAANMTLVRRYLETYGPATCRDFAHWRGCRVSDARRWWDAVTDDASCYVVVHEGERGQQMIACKSDLELLETHVRGARCAHDSMVVR